MLFGGGSRAEAPPPAEIQAPVNQANAYGQQGAACSVEAKGGSRLFTPSVPDR